LRTLYSRLITKVALFAKEKIENFRHTHLAKQAGGTSEIMEPCQQVDHAFFDSAMCDQLMGIGASFTCSYFSCRRALFISIFFSPPLTMSWRL
jgi:hypothetical protein